MRWELDVFTFEFIKGEMNTSFHLCFIVDILACRINVTIFGHCVSIYSFHSTMSNKFAIVLTYSLSLSERR